MQFVELDACKIHGGALARHGVDYGSAPRMKAAHAKPPPRRKQLDLVLGAD
jgi:hypothetical protein